MPALLAQAWGGGDVLHLVDLRASRPSALHACLQLPEGGAGALAWSPLPLDTERQMCPSVYLSRCVGYVDKASLQPCPDPPFPGIESHPRSLPCLALSAPHPFCGLTPSVPLWPPHRSCLGSSLLLFPLRILPSSRHPHGSLLPLTTSL